MEKIEFRGEKMSLQEAKTLLNKLKEGSVNIELNDLERIGYNQMNESTRRENEKKKARGDEKLYEEFSERGYLELLLSIPIGLKEHFDKIKNCKKNGHIEETVLSCDSSGRALCYCSKCGDMYDRPMNYEEHIDFNKLMQTPMTI